MTIPVGESTTARIGFGWTIVAEGCLVESPRVYVHLPHYLGLQVSMVVATGESPVLQRAVVLG